ncbi:MAG: hypothetical protein ACREPE_15260, partial [Lysobacter sp.]
MAIDGSAVMSRESAVKPGLVIPSARLVMPWEGRNKLIPFVVSLSNHEWNQRPASLRVSDAWLV